MNKNASVVLKKCWLIITLVYCAFPLYASTTIHKPLQNLMDEYVHNGYMPGIVLGLYIDDAPPVFLMSGMSDINQHQPMHAQLLFKFGSTIKTLTAILLLEKLKLEKLPVTISLQDILESYPNVFAKELRTLTKEYVFLNKITLQQLLNHTSHLVDEQTTTDYLQKFSQGRNSSVSMMEHLRFSLKRGQTKVEFSYANINYILLGQIIEILYNKAYKDVITENLFNKLNLKNTYYYFSATDLGDLCHQQAHAYEPALLGSVAVFKERPRIQNLNDSQLDYIDLTCSYHPAWDDGPAGALLATPEDLGQLSKQLFYQQSSLAKNYWDYLSQMHPNPNAKKWFGPFEMQYQSGIWRGKLTNNIEFWRLIGEQWGFSGGAIFVPKQKNYPHSILLIYAINTDQPDFLEGTYFSPGFISRALNIITQPKCYYLQSN